MKRSCLILLAWASLATSVQAVEILKWERLPLAIPLHVDQERIVFVERNVRVGVPATLGDALRVQSTGGAIYLRANAPIEPTRLQLQDMSNGELILIDIVATPAAAGQPALEPVKIVAGESLPKRYGQEQELASDADEAIETDEELVPKPVRETPIPVVLTRYAAQSLYAPLRTVEPVDGVSQVQLRRSLDLSSLLPLLPLRATALGAWTLDDFWVTAVKLQNLSATPLTLAPRELQGNFATATFQHRTLGTRGDPSDTTTVYLVTQGNDLSGALIPSIGRIDPMAKTETREPGHAR